MLIGRKKNEWRVKSDISLVVIMHITLKISLIEECIPAGSDMNELGEIDQ